MIALDEDIGTLAWIHPRESLQEALSLASRLAGLNGRPMENFLQEMGVSPTGLAQSDPDEVRKLARLAGIDATQLLRDTAVRSSDRRFWTLRGERLAKRSIIRERFRYCPKCLQDDLETVDGPIRGRPWLRVEWGVQNIRSCIRHRVMLVDGVVQSRQSYDFLKAVEPFLPELSGIADRSRTVERSEFEEWIFDRLNGRGGSKAWLDGLELYVGIAFCERLGVSTSFPPKTKLSKLTVAESREAAEAGFLIASHGPSAVEEALSRLNSRQRRSKGMWSPNDTFGEIYAALKRAGKDPAWKIPSDLVADFMVRSMPLEPGTVVLGRTVERQAFHTIRSATKLSGMHHRTIRTFLKRNSIDVGGPKSGLSDHRVTIDAPGIEKTLVALRDSIGAIDARRRTGFPSKWFLTAVADGHLSVLAHSKNVLPGRNRFAVAAVDDMMLRLFRSAEVTDAMTEKRLGLAAVQRRARTTMSRMLDIVFGSTAIWKGRLSSARGFDSLLLDLDEVRLIVGSKERPVGLSMLEILAFIPGIHRASPKLLASDGLLEIVDEFNPVSQRMQPVFTRESAERFKATYVTLSELSRVTGSATIPTRNRLRGDNVDQVFTRKSHGFVAYIRSEAERALNLPAKLPSE